MTQKEITVLMVEPGKHPKVTTLKDDLDSLQKAVSIGADYQGLIEFVSLGNGDCIMCNEEGKLIGLDGNRRLGNDILVGVFYIMSENEDIFLETKDPSDFAKKQRMVEKFIDQQCRDTFNEIASEIYPIFQKYGVSMPTLRIRAMDTRWGSCLAKKGIVTLNKRLLEAPRNCIEYVVMHEFCHFIHPNHSKHFYAFLSMLMPDWKDRKKILELLH